MIAKTQQFPLDELFTSPTELTWSMLPHLSELPGNTDGPAEAIASNEQCLHTPAPEMTECKNVKMTQDPLPGNDMAVHSIFLQRVAHTASDND